MIRALKVTREEGFDSRKTLSPFLFTQAARTKDRTSHYVTLPWYQNFQKTTNGKRHLKSEFALFQTSTMSFNFI